MAIPIAQTLVQFVCNGFKISINGPEGPTDPETQPQFVFDQAADLTPYCYQTTETVMSTWVLPFNNLTKADWLALRTFFYNQAMGPTNLFTYTHTDKKIYANCRFWQPSLKVQRRSGFDMSVQITLLVPGFVTANPEVDS